MCLFLVSISSLSEVEVWLGRGEANISLLSCTDIRWKDRVSLLQPKCVGTAVGVVGEQIWTGDSSGILHGIR